VIAAALAATTLAVGAPAAPPAAGAPFATISIPAIGLHALVREGVRASVLDSGPGHYRNTGTPGGGRTIGIAGHRVTHTRPFLHINRLRYGQRIVLTRHNRRFVYRVFAMRIVAPAEIWPIHLRRTREMLVLTACHPPRTGLRRLAVFAELSDS
jgi:sortase A